MKTPLSVVRSIGDKLIRDTRFEYKLEVASVNHSFHNEEVNGLQFVDFGGRSALAAQRLPTPSPSLLRRGTWR
jgi:hypothetical protein